MDQITSKQLTEWQAYETLEPMGNIESSYMAASICAVVINSIASIFKSKKSGRSKLISPMDFIPDWGKQEDVLEEEPVKEQTVDQQKVVLLSIAKAFGAKNKRKGVTK